MKRIITTLLVVVTSKMQDFGNRKFFYIVAGGDQKASGGMKDLQAVLAEMSCKISNFASLNRTLVASHITDNA